MTDMTDLDNRLDGLDERFEDVKSRSSRLENRRDMIESTLFDLQQEVDRLEHDILRLKKTEKLFQHLLDEYVHSYAESFSSIVTEGLQTIFYDQDLSFDVRVDQKRSKVYIEFITKRGKKEGQALESFGGGVAAVESLLMRILVILKTGLSRTLVLDESLASLSEEYIETMSSFLRTLSDNLDMDILLITHNRLFSKHADTAYYGREEMNDQGDDHLVLEEVSE